MSLQFLGYEVLITYDDYDSHKVIMETLDNLNSICQALENRDNIYVVEHRKKYDNNGEVLYGETTTLELENENIPLKHRVIKSFYEKALVIYEYEDQLQTVDVQSCIDDLDKLIKILEGKQ